MRETSSPPIEMCFIAVSLRSPNDFCISDQTPILLIPALASFLRRDGNGLHLLRLCQIVDNSCLFLHTSGETVSAALSSTHGEQILYSPETLSDDIQSRSIQVGGTRRGGRTPRGATA